ncbi:hypothetical protein [Streptomyces sp. NPDC047123]|uniref:hypothetical protein n=1 Tax=Streptomyces sp. NPDC047123 TaxID=3155622 RepID=UPI0033CA3082
MRHHPRHHLRARLRRSAAVAACLTAAAVGLAACGTESTGTAAERSEAPKGPFAGLSGADIAQKAIAATSKATSLRIAGKVTDEESGPMSLDMALNTSGTCAGTIGSGQGSVELRIPGPAAGGTVYMKYDEKFLRAQSKGEPAADVQAAVDMVAGRWAKTRTTSADAKEIGSFCDLDVLLADFKDSGTLARRGATTTVDGTPAIKLTESDGKATYTLYVATRGKPYLLRIDSRDRAAQPESLTFTDYGKPVRATPPTGDVLDLDKL